MEGGRRRGGGEGGGERHAAETLLSCICLHVGLRGDNGREKDRKRKRMLKRGREGGKKDEAENDKEEAMGRKGRR